jgi:hypothetical protein
VTDEDSAESEPADLASLQCPFDLTALPTLAASELRLLWINDWYDGPIDAVAEYRGERCLFALADPNLIASSRDWVWLLLRFSPEDLAEEEHWHRLFLQHVGDHWNCTGETHPPASGQHDLFYKPYKERSARDLTHYVPIGVVHQMPEPKGQRIG